MSARGLVDVADVRAGDSVFIDRIGSRVVSAVVEYEPGRWTVVYFSEEETAWEGSASRGRRGSTTRRLVEKQLRWFPAGQMLEVERGHSALADRLRKELERGVAERTAQQQARAQWRDDRP